MKKFGKVLLAAAITFGGVGAVELVKPSSKVEAATVTNAGISVNPVADTLNLKWHSSATVAVKNDNEWAMIVEITLKDDQGSALLNQTVTLQPEEKQYLSFSTNWKTDGTQYHYSVLSHKPINDPYPYAGSLESTAFTVITGYATTTTTTEPTYEESMYDSCMDGAGSDTEAQRLCGRYEYNPAG